MSKKITVEFVGNSKIADVYFFNRDLDGVLKDFKGESFSKFLAETADHTEYFARGFNEEGDLKVKVSSGDDILYNGIVFLDQATPDATPDEVRALFLEDNDVEYDEVLSYNDYARVSPDHYMPDLSKYKKCITREVDLDGYNGVSELTLTVADDFKLSDIKIIMSTFDSEEAPWAASLIANFYRSGDLENEVLGIEYNGVVQLITNESYKSDLIREPFTFIGTTRYSAYNYDSGKWEWDGGQLDDDLGELGETEE